MSSCYFTFEVCVLLGFLSIFTINCGVAHFTTLNERVEETKETCGYRSCPNSTDGVINVHLVPHSHDDTGWLKTVDQYYVGSNRAMFGGIQENQRVGVQYVLDSVVKELMFDPNKR